jgi:hypothetical protein
MGSRTVDRGIWFVLVDPVPRYPTIDNEVDERAADLVDRAQNIEEQPLSQIHRHDARSPVSHEFHQLNRRNRKRITKPGPG